MKKSGSTALSPQAMKHLKRIRHADLLVGIPSYNNAHTINFVVYQAAKGLATYFPQSASVIFIADGHSTDGTLAAVRALRFSYNVQVIPTYYAGLPGKGSAVKAICEAATFLEARAVALVDSDLRSITLEWINLLLSPCLHKTDLVAPLYIRDKYDGTITNFLCYPMTASLYRKPIRQPIGGDFGLSLPLIRELLESPLWHTPYVHTFGIDIFETHTALAKEFEVKQAFLGTKIHEAKDPSEHLAPMFRQVVGSMFGCIEHYEQAWMSIRGSREVDTIGVKDYSPTPEPVAVNFQDLVNTYRSSFPANASMYRAILPYALLAEFVKLTKQKADDFFISSEIWAKTVYTFAARFKDLEQQKREDLLEALRILWIGRVASFINEAECMTSSEANSRVEEEAETFLKLRPYLINTYSKDAKQPY